MYSFLKLETVCSMSCSNCCFLAYIQIYRETGNVVWDCHLFKNFIVIHTVKGFGVISEEVDTFLVFFWFFYDPEDVGNLISGSSAISKSSLNIWKFMVHVLLKPVLENFEHYFAIVWDDCNCAIGWTFFDIAFLWDWNENWLFQSCGHCWVFQICWHVECSTFMAPSLGLEIAQLDFHHLHQLCSSWCFLRPTWLCIPGCMDLGESSHHLGYLVHLDLFCIVLLCLLTTSSVRSIPFLSFIEPIFAWNVPLVSLISLKRP